MLEGRNFIGIEKNDDVQLFKDVEIDYIEVARNRLLNAYASLEDSDTLQTIARTGIFDGFPCKDSNSEAAFG